MVIIYILYKLQFWYLNRLCLSDKQGAYCKYAITRATPTIFIRP